MQMSLIHTHLSPGEVAVSNLKVGASVPQTATGRDWFTSKAQRCRPSYLSVDGTGNIGTLSMWAEATEKCSIGSRWSWALVFPEGREPSSHRGRGRPWFSAHTAISVVKPRKPWNVSPTPCDAALGTACSSFLLGIFCPSAFDSAWSSASPWAGKVRYTHRLGEGNSSHSII